MFGRRTPKRRSEWLRGWVWPQGGFARVGRYLWLRLGRLRASPHGIAAGLAAGASVSFLPLPGVHFALGAVLALATRGSVIAAMIGTTIGNPWTFPFIWLGAYQIGRGLGIGPDIQSQGVDLAGGGISAHLHTAVADLLSGHFRDAAIKSWPMFAPTLAGGAIMAIAIWALVYFGVRPIVARAQARRRLKLAEGRARWHKGHHRHGASNPTLDATGEHSG